MLTLYIIGKSTVVCFSLKTERSDMTLYILLKILFVTYMILSVYSNDYSYAIMTFHSINLYDRYNNVIVIVSLIGYHIFMYFTS